MPNTHTTLKSLFDDIADAIRAKDGSSATIVADNFPARINSIPTGITPTGTKTITENGTYDVTNFASAAVNVQGGGIPLPATITPGDTPVLTSSSGGGASSSSYADSGVSLTIPKAGTYRFKWLMSMENTGSFSTRLYKNNVAVGVEQTKRVSSIESDWVWIVSDELQCNAGDIIKIYIKGVSNWTGTYGTCGMLTACINWDISQLWN